MNPLFFVVCYYKTNGSGLVTPVGVPAVCGQGR